METVYRGSAPPTGEEYSQANAKIAALASDFVGCYRTYRQVLKESGPKSGRAAYAKEDLEAFLGQLMAAVDTHPYQRHLAEAHEKHLDQYDPKRIHAGRTGRR